MAKPTELVIHVVPGELQFGIWCPDCLTSAAVRIETHLLWPSGVGNGPTLIHCTRCKPGDDDA